MLKVWQKAKKLGLVSIPARVANHSGYLPWHDSWNRDFLTQYFNVGLKNYYDEKYEEAYWIFNHLMELSPNDNQEASHFAINCCMEFGRHVAILNICDKYPNYVDSFLYYAKILAMFSTSGESLIERQITKAINSFPKHAKLISQKNRQKEYHLKNTSIMVGSVESAQNYWNMQGKYWLDNPEAIEKVRSIYRNNN